LTACFADESLSTTRFVDSSELRDISLQSRESGESGPEWVIGGAEGELRKRPKSQERLLNAARITWPGVLAYARLVGVTDYEWLATEVWEELLRSVLRTIRRRGLDHVTDLEAYLNGAFRHRFHRELLRDRNYREKVVQPKAVETLEQFGKIQDWKPVQRMERDLWVQQTLKLLDPWTRRVWNYIKYGYSIKEIARCLDLTEFQVEFRYRRRLTRLREYLGRRGGTSA
jgi:DNA-directed RNA polymerase specialized sigma24 family protein